MGTTRFLFCKSFVCRNTHTFESKREEVEEEEEEWVRRCTTAWRRTCTWRKRRSSGSRLASSLGAGGSIRTGNAEGKSRGTTRKCQRINRVCVGIIVQRKTDTRERERRLLRL